MKPGQTVILCFYRLVMCSIPDKNRPSKQIIKEQQWTECVLCNDVTLMTHAAGTVCPASIRPDNRTVVVCHLLQFTKSTVQVEITVSRFMINTPDISHTHEAMS